MGKNEEIEVLKEEMEELAAHLADMLEAALYFAGVKKEKLQKAAGLYVDAIDEVFEDQEGEMGVDEIIKVVEYLKRTHGELFE
ncbi:MAG: hypothetical protein B6D59_01430 [Campylobacteraceae bacterium 4484_4]|nr:MAG: hypothetical protein B6D59_01430 [Campylobacteraceae bacterium 4484_4]